MITKKCKWFAPNFTFLSHCFDSSCISSLRKLGLGLFWLSWLTATSIFRLWSWESSEWLRLLVELLFKFSMLRRMAGFRLRGVVTLAYWGGCFTSSCLTCSTTTIGLGLFGCCYVCCCTTYSCMSFWRLEVSVTTEDGLSVSRLTLHRGGCVSYDSVWSRLWSRADKLVIPYSSFVLAW